VVERETTDGVDRDPSSLSGVVPTARGSAPAPNMKDHRGRRLPRVAIRAGVDPDEAIGPTPQTRLLEKLPDHRRLYRLP
jgi:hypothetical protein